MHLQNKNKKIIVKANMGSRLMTYIDSLRYLYLKTHSILETKI